VLMANEVIEDIKRGGKSGLCLKVDIKRGGKSGLCLKVDFKKAYDLVRWEFLYDMVHKMGFHSKWIN